MGHLTRNIDFSSGHTLSSGAGTSEILSIGDYVAFGLLARSTGATCTSIGFNVGFSTGTLLPLVDELNTVVTVPISTATRQAYDLPASLAPWRYVQITSTGGSTALLFDFIRKG